MNQTKVVGNKKNHTLKPTKKIHLKGTILPF